MQKWKQLLEKKIIRKAPFIEYVGHVFLSNYQKAQVIEV